MRNHVERQIGSFMFRKLLPYVGKYKRQAILTPVMVALEVFMEILIPLLMAAIIDLVNGMGFEDLNPASAYVLRLLGVRVKDAFGIGDILIIGGIMVALALFSLLFGALGGKYAAESGSGFAANLRAAQFHKVQTFSFANVDKFSTASLVTRMTTDIMFTRMTFTTFIRMLARSPLMMIGSTIMAVSINARLSLVFLIAIPVLGSVIFFITIKTHPRFVAMFKKYDAMNARVQENLIGIRVVKAFVRGDHEEKNFTVSSEDVYRAEVRAQKLIVFLMPAVQFTMYACMIAISWFGGRQIVLDGTMTTGELMSFISYITQILVSLTMISMAFVTFVISRASMARIVEVLEEVPDISDKGADPDLIVPDGSIVFDHVDFSYTKDENSLNLKDVSFTIPAGATVGIIGSTGSAKTTLVQLIPRLYDVQKGAVIVGGRNVKDYTLEHLRDSVAMVLQKNTLFSGTIASNLRWGNEKADMETIRAACRAAQADEFISAFPDGYETDISQGGVNLSGGQKQRVCIARALLKDPKILILDDSTSAVDMATDAKIRASFKKLREDMTTLIIAQRISSVKDADLIFVMDDGEIRDVGTHKELLERSEIYQEVYESQQEAAREGQEVADRG